MESQQAPAKGREKKQEKLLFDSPSSKDLGRKTLKKRKNMSPTLLSSIKINGMRLLKYFLLILGLLIGTGGLYLAFDQYWKINNFKPVDARVISTSIEKHVSRSGRGGRSVSYSPVVKYTYSVGSEKHESNQVFPISFSGSYEFAKKTIEMFPPGKRTTAYIDPGDPSRSFLVKRYFFIPYLLVLVGILLFLFHLVIRIYTLNPVTRPLPPRKVQDDLFQLIPTSSVKRKKLWFPVSSVIWLLGSLITLGHYFIVAPQPRETYSYYVTAACGIVFLVFLVLSIWYHVLSRNVEEASLFLDRDKIRLGDKVLVAYLQEFKKDLFVEKASIGLVCEAWETTRTGRNRTTRKTIHWEEWTDILENGEVKGGEALEGTRSFEIPGNLPPSTTRAFTLSKRYYWNFRVRISIKNSPDFNAKYPILVLP